MDYKKSFLIVCDKPNSTATFVTQTKILKYRHFKILLAMKFFIFHKFCHN